MRFRAPGDPRPPRMFRRLFFVVMMLASLLILAFPRIAGIINVVSQVILLAIVIGALVSFVRRKKAEPPWTRVVR